MCGASASTEASRCEHCGARLATVSCPSCFGMMFIGQKFCSHCGQRADRAEIKSERLPCPRCRVPMNTLNLGGTLLQNCPKCDGLWADTISLNQLCADREKQAAVLGMPTPVESTCTALDKNIRYVPCPVCGKLMNRVNFARCSHVVVDVCREHGTWFDTDELRRIVSFIRSGGLEQAREREIAELEERRRRAKVDQITGAWGNQPGAFDLEAGYRHDGISAVARALRSILSGD